MRVVLANPVHHAYTSEIIRGGLLSVPEKHIEAIYNCGMTRQKVFYRIILSVALRLALPAYDNKMISKVKRGLVGLNHYPDGNNRHHR